MDDERTHHAEDPGTRRSQVRIAGAEPAAHRAERAGDPGSDARALEAEGDPKASRARAQGEEELPWPRPADPWGSGDLPHWTEAPTGEVPAVLARDERDPQDDDPWAGLPAPTWREEGADWEADADTFAPSVFADEEPLGALDDRGPSEQPWSFDLDAPKSQPRSAATQASDVDGEGTRAEVPASAGRTAYPGAALPGSEEDEPTMTLPAVRRHRVEEASAYGEGDGGDVTREPAAPQPPAQPSAVLSTGDKGVFDFDEEVGLPAAEQPPGPQGMEDLEREDLDALQVSVPGGPDATGLDPLALDEPGREVVAERHAEAPSRPRSQGAPSGRREPPSRRPPPTDRGARRRPPTRPEVARRSRPGRRPAGQPRRQRTMEEATGRNLPVAVATGVGFVAVTLICFAISSLAALALAAVVVGVAGAEAYGALRQAGHRPATLLGLVAVVGLMLAAYAKGFEAEPLVATLLVGFLFLWYLAKVERTDPLAGASSTLFVFAWVGILGSYGGLLLAPGYFPDRHGIAFLLGAVIAAVAYDVGALAFGAWLGRRPLLPEVSPNKTWEGFLGGAGTTIVMSVIFVRAINPWDFGTALALGIVVAVVAPLGDLAESLVKRHLGLKDMGHFLPGHGGVLDRIDGLLFVLPATYYLVRALNIG